MKRMIAFLFCTIILFLIIFAKSDNFEFINEYDKLIVISKNLNISQDYQLNGDQYYYSFTKDEGNEFLEKEANNYEIDGYVFYFNNLFNINKFSKYVDFLLDKNTQIEGYEIYYGYYSGSEDFRYINNKKINFQLAHHNDEWILGFPAILTGF